MHRLRTTKIKVLEIVWCYLYSSRERDAWRALDEMWPHADIDRIRTSILTARSGGIIAQIDSVSTDVRKKRNRAHIYETAKEADDDTATRPRPILLWRPLPNPEVVPDSEQVVDLVIDAAGKVRSAQMVGESDDILTGAAKQWRFVPAFKDGRPVASRMRLPVAPSQ